MSVLEYSVNMNNKCGNCKDFSNYEEKGYYGRCVSYKSKIKNKEPRSIFSKGCTSIRRINGQKN